MNSIKAKLLIITALIGVAMLAMQSSSIAETAVNSPIGAGDELNRRIRDYLLNHPEVIVEAFQRRQAQQQRALTERANAALKERREEIFNDPHSPIGGNPNGDVTVVEFMDYNCDYCRRVFRLLAQLLKDDTKVRLSFKEFPVLGPGSEFAARAALAAQKQGRYMEFHTALMQSKAPLEEPQALAIAEQVEAESQTT